MVSISTQLHFISREIPLALWHDALGITATPHPKYLRSVAKADQFVELLQQIPNLVAVVDTLLKSGLN